MTVRGPRNSITPTRARTSEAIVTTVAQKVIAKRERCAKEGETRLSEKLGLLNKLLWGGSALLAFEHVWHGELSPVFPFLTGENVLGEMATNGVAMALLVTAVWGGMLAVMKHFRREKHTDTMLSKHEEERA